MRWAALESMCKYCHMQHVIILSWDVKLDLGNLDGDCSLLLIVWKGNDKHMAVDLAPCGAVPKPCNIYSEQQLLEET